MRFQYGSNKVVIELRVVQFWSEIILVDSNRTRTARSFDFEIMRMISEIALHSTQFNYRYKSNVIYLSLKVLTTLTALKRAKSYCEMKYANSLAPTVSKKTRELQTGPSCSGVGV